MTNAVNNLNNIIPFNGSYLLGFLSRFGPVFDYNLNHISLPESPHLIYLDDEMFAFENLGKFPGMETLPSSLLDTKHIFICKIKWIHDYLQKHGCQSILCPWFHNIDHVISMRLLNDKISINHPVNGNGAYFCLNRCDRPHRRELVEYLLEKRLLSNGKVTYRENTPNIEGLYEGEDLKYDPGYGGFERHKQQINGVWVNAIVQNFLSINQHYLQPINIVAETGTFRFFPTEKSFQSILTKRLPIILASEFRIQELREEGFDMFDWILNHEYDTILNDYNRSRMMIDKNLDILTEEIEIDSKIKDVLNYNYEHAMTTWLDSKLNELQTALETILPTWKR